MRAVIKVIVTAHIEDDAAPSLDALTPAQVAEATGKRTALAYQVATNLGLVGEVTGREDCTRLVKMLEGTVAKAAQNLSLKVAGPKAAGS